MALARTLALMLTAATLATPALAAEPPAPQAKADDWPTGAPRDDYQFTAWCYGVLARHMELYKEVKPDLDAISKRWNTEAEDKKSYAEQLAAGKDQLAKFQKALTAAEKASPRPINAAGAAAVEQGRRMWATFNTVEPNWRAYSWMNWELPEKCVTVSAALEEKAILMSPALKANAPAPAKEPVKKAETPAKAIGLR